MRLIPVVDIQHGIVVRGIGGRRAAYRPLVSCLTSSTTPQVVVRSLSQSFHPQELYIADLDAIDGRSPSWPQLAAGCDPSIRLWIDAGIRLASDLCPLAKAAVAGIVLGLETISSPAVLETAIAEIGSERIVFSLDLSSGRLLGDWRKWAARDERDWPAVAERAVRAGVGQMILLDLKCVGEGHGTGTEEICRVLTATYPELEIICGGGVRDVSDLIRLRNSGAAGALVASALHDGRIKPGDVGLMIDD